MGEIKDHLPWRDGLDLFESESLDAAAVDYADQIIKKGVLRANYRQDLIAALRRAGLWYLFGRYVGPGIASNKERAKAWREAGYEEAARLLKLRSRGQPPRYGEQALIWVMTDAWEYFGLNPGTASGRGMGDEQSPFQRTCKGWIQAIEKIPRYRDQPQAFDHLPGKNPKPPPPPSRSVYRDTRKRRTKQKTD